MQVVVTITEARAAGVTHPVTSRSYMKWQKLLRPVLLAKGVPDSAIDAGRTGVHIQGDGEKYLFVFHDRDAEPIRDAAARTAAAAVIETQAKALARKSSKRSRGDA